MKTIENQGLPVQGDFYNDGDCLICGAPHAEAPTLIDYTPDGRCYFKQQPQNEVELDQAICALWVSCIGAIRYRGTDEAILKRLYENGLADSCDYQPLAAYPLLIRDRLRFAFDGSINELADALISKVKSSTSSEYLADKIVQFHNDERQSFSFVHIWYDAANSVTYNVDYNINAKHELVLGISPEFEKDIIGTAARLHDNIKGDARFKSIEWFEKDKNNQTSYSKPY
ncbi:hypothetical protein Q5H92_24015 [Hymenobacter sp. M29]|uniref:Uncharacterized protein n=1 Tax=Hymenobacter mellowenesis TaxID=3063995 RepID=A0ABT9AJB9_9BACT|nr:hypothetical protein [Hymenobacter sp. M29]MDO7849452.1 hypothetical protein [Hymenobacter sp. M29]